MNASQRQALAEIDGFLAEQAGNQSERAAAIRAKLLHAFPSMTGGEDAILEDELTVQQKSAAFDNMMSGLKDLGFGSDDPIDGADVVDAINELIEDTETRFGV